MAYREGSQDPISSEVVFFLGAGASVNAGVPTTYSFVSEYIESIFDPDKKETIQKIVDTLEKWKDDKIDIELLLETLSKLKDKNQEPLLQFFTDCNYILEGYIEKEPLVNSLKDFIKSRAIVESEDRIRYLEPFREFIEESRPIDIISVNYDTSLELFSSCHRLTYQDGFDSHWNPAVFKRKHTDIRLYKIHGSVMWYQSDRGGYIKSSIMERGSKVELITRERAENLMLYPMQKWNYAEPFLELLVMVKNLLESELCKFLVIVGYSFRDDHILRILWDIARKNKELHFILIDPHAYQIYKNKLKYYPTSEKVPSSMEGRVICLPYLFEKVFPHVKNRYLKKIEEGLNFETSQRREKNRGEKANFIACLQSYAEAEYTEKIEMILESDTLTDKKYWAIKLEIYLKMAVNLITNKEKEKGEEFYSHFNDLFYEIMVERSEVKITTGIFDKTGRIEFLFNPSNTPVQKGYESPNIDERIGLERIKENLTPLFQFCKIRRGFIDQSEKDALDILQKVEKIERYLEDLERNSRSFEDYIAFRKNKIPDITRFNTLYEKFLKEGHQFIGDYQLGSIVSDMEKKIFTEFIEKE